MTGVKTTLVSALLLSTALGTHSLAQTQSQDQSDITYPSAFFTQFNALTALDMAQQVPGFSIDTGDSRRGLAGTLSNVLINGSRVGTKGTGVLATLRRIPAGDVANIELIRTPRPGIDMRGETSVINIELIAGAGRSASLRTRLTHWENDRIRPSGDASVTFTSLNRDLTIGTELNSNGEGEVIHRQMYNGQDQLQYYTRERDNESMLEIAPYIRFTQRFNNGDVLNFSGQHWNWKDDWVNFAWRYGTQNEQTQFESQRRDKQGHRTDINLDYQHNFSDTLSGQLIGYWRDSNPDTAMDFITTDLNTGEQRHTRIDDVVKFGETIVRSQIRWSPEGQHAFEFSLERAFNFRDSHYDRYSGTGGTLNRIPLPLSNTRVEEVRWDGSLAHVWQARDDLSLETTLAYEMSTITQTGDAEQERDLSYFKPSVVATWSPSERDQIRLGLFRDIGQLDFEDFISSVDLKDDQTNVGNPNLEPFQAWRILAEWERRFDEQNNVKVTLMHGRYDALTGIIPLGQGEGPGSLKDGVRTQVNVRGDFSLDRFHIPNARLQPSLTVYRTDIKDPYTQQTRNFPGLRDWSFDLDYRQDFREQGWAWGFDYVYHGQNQYYRLNEEGFNHLTRGHIALFLETTRFFGLTTRLQGDMLIKDDFKRQRYLYAPNRATGTLTGHEIMYKRYLRSVYLEISKTF